jgi:hypothetical protein
MAKRGSQERRIGRWIDSMERSRHVVEGESSVRARHASRSSRAPDQRCSPARLVPHRRARGPISNQAEVRCEPTDLRECQAPLKSPRHDQPDSAQYSHAESGQYQEQPRPIIRHTRDPRDHLDSFANVVGAGPARPPLLVSNSQRGRRVRLDQAPGLIPRVQVRGLVV